MDVTVDEKGEMNIGKDVAKPTKIIIDQSKVIKTLPRMVKENFQAVPGSTHTVKK